MAVVEYRATRNEPRVGVGEWTGDFQRGIIYEEVFADERGRFPRTGPNGHAGIPSHLIRYLMSHGLIVDARVSDEPLAEPDVQPQAIVKVEALDE